MQTLFGAEKGPASSHLQESAAAAPSTASTSTSTSTPATPIPNPNSNQLVPPNNSAKRNLNSSIQSNSYNASFASYSSSTSLRPAPDGNNYFDSVNSTPNQQVPTTPTAYSNQPLPLLTPAAFSTSAPVSPPIQVALPTTDNQPSTTHSIDRSELHKSLKNLESLLVSLDEYRDLSNKMAKVEKRIAKNAGELAKGKSVKEIPGECPRRDG